MTVRLRRQIWAVLLVAVVIAVCIGVSRADSNDDDDDDGGYKQDGYDSSYYQ